MSTYYGSSVADTTLTTACDMATTTGGTETSKTTAISGGGHFAEVYSQGGAQTAQTSILAPSGKGWISSAPGAGAFATGNWSASCTFSFAAWDSGNTVTIRFYRLSSGVYNSIGTIVTNVTGTAKTTYSFSATSMSSNLTFGASDQLYVDMWFTDSTGTGGDQPTVYESNSASAGVANDVQITTTTFTPTAGATKKDIAFLGKVAALGIKDIAFYAKIALGAQKDIAFLAKIVAPPPQIGVAISNSAVVFDEDTFQLHLKADERQRMQLTVLDYAGTARYTARQKITVDDPTLGRLFSGVLLDDKLDKSNVYPDATIEHQIDTTGNEYFADKRAFNRLYTTPTYASSIVFDAVADVLASEGIVAPYARDIDTTKTDWSAGTLTNTVASSNVGDGDLELFSTGGIVTASYSSSSDWTTGTLTNLVVNAGGDISLNGFTRNWSDNSTANQTLFGNSSPTQSASGGIFSITSGSDSTGHGETRSRLDAAGNWSNGTYEIDMLLDEDTSQHSFAYMTTNWISTDSTWAYAIELTTSRIAIRVGTNGGSAISSDIGANSFGNTLSHGWYRIRIVVNGNNHKAFINGTQYINANDSTWTSPGQIAIRNRNKNTSGTETMKYRNFGVMLTTSGTWQSTATSINSVTTISASTIGWDQSLSQGGTVLVQTSIDGGSSFQVCSNGGVIPGLTTGVSGTGKTVIVKISLSTTTTATMPDLKSLSWSVVGGYVASGTRVSPVLSLGSTGRIGSTLVAWNANLPSAATTLGIDTSIDGGMTWTDVSNNNGGPIPGLNVTPEPTIDGFDSNSAMSYINTNGYGGSAATWAFDTANSRVIATNGASSMLLYGGISIANIDLFVDMDYSDAAGLAFCCVDQNNYYGVAVADNQASVGVKNTITLYKMASSVQTTLASASISFTRGLLYRIRATNTDGTIKVFWDGAQKISYSDSSPLGPGLAGLFQTGGFTANWAPRPFGGTVDLGNSGGANTLARFYQLWLQPLGDNASGKTVQTRCRLATTDNTLTPQVLDLTVAAYSQNVNVGTLIPSADYRMKTASAMLDDTAKQSNYAWWVDQYKTLNFRHRSAVPAPWILQSTSLAVPVDLEADSNLGVTIANDLFRNRQNLTGVLNTGAFPAAFQGDGQTTSFTLSFPIAPGTVPIITLNTVPQKVGKKGTSGAQYYYADSGTDAVIAQDSALTKLISTDRLAVTYTGIFTTTVTIDNTASQAALAPKEGGSGIVEATEDVSNRNMMYDAAVTYAQQLLTRYCIDGRTITYTTYRNGLYPGQIQSVFLPELGLYDAQMFITAIDVTMRKQPGSTILYCYSVTATELANQGSWSKLLASSILLT